MTQDEKRALALEAAVEFVATQPGTPTMVDVASAYNFFFNLINIAVLRNATQTFATQKPYIVTRHVADPSTYTANVNGG